MKTKLKESSMESYISVVEKWTHRELQLHWLQEEILAKRVSLLHTDRDYFKGQSHRGYNEQLSLTNNVTLRNQYLIQDIEELQGNRSKNNLKIPNPKFLMLERNYVAMMNGILPLWEKYTQGPQEKETNKPDTPNPIQS